MSIGICKDGIYGGNRRVVNGKKSQVNPTQGYWVKRYLSRVRPHRLVFKEVRGV